VWEIHMLRLTRRELEIGYGVDTEALSTERGSKLTRPTCSHYASSRPYLRGPGGEIPPGYSPNLLQSELSHHTVMHTARSPNQWVGC